MSNLPLVEIERQPIELCKLLKIANLVGGGGEAKMVISEGYVYVNGELETQKRKKIYENDVIEFDGDAVQVAVVKGSLVKTKIEKVPSNTKKTSQNNQPLSTTQPSSVETRSKRKPISF